MIENWINSGIIFINDIIDDHGNISEVVILHNLICRQHWMSETSIVKKSIPAELKQIIKSEESIMKKVNVSFVNTPIYLNSQNLSNQTSKNIYNNLLNSQNTSILLGFSIWLNKINIKFYSEIEKSLAFVLTNMKENKFKVYKWKLIHYILSCKKLLFKWHITTNNLCNNCQITENYEHSLNAKDWKHFGE